MEVARKDCDQNDGGEDGNAEAVGDERQRAQHPTEGDDRDEHKGEDRKALRVGAVVEPRNGDCKDDGCGDEKYLPEEKPARLGGLCAGCKPGRNHHDNARNAGQQLKGDSRQGPEGNRHRRGERPQSPIEREEAERREQREVVALVQIAARRPAIAGNREEPRGPPQRRGDCGILQNIASLVARAVRAQKQPLARQKDRARRGASKARYMPAMRRRLVGEVVESGDGVPERRGQDDSNSKPGRDLGCDHAFLMAVREKIPENEDVIELRSHGCDPLGMSAVTRKEPDQAAGRFVAESLYAIDHHDAGQDQRDKTRGNQEKSGAEILNPARGRDDPADQRAGAARVVGPYEHQRKPPEQRLKHRK